MNIEQDESNVLRDAVRSGVIPVQLPVFDKIDVKVFDWVSENYKPQPYWQKDPQFAPQTQRYQEHTFPVWTYTNNFALPALVELSRIIVPRGDVGYLKSIEQFIQDADAGFYPTASEFWGLPYQDDADLAACRWYLRLSNFDGFQPPRFISISATMNPDTRLPGQAYYDLPQFQNIWYPPHCASKLPNMVIPGGTMLRFFFYSPPTTTWRWQAMGRLRAVVQTAQCREANYNTRVSSW